jgi:N-acetylmuramoyl-L-alanine amidase
MIFLSAGHSTVDSGAVTSVKDAAGQTVVRKEADIAEEFRNLVSFCLTDLKVEHTADGVGHQNMTLAETVKIVGKNRPALEFHCNAAEDHRASGAETLSAPKDMALGSKLCAAIANVLGIPNRGAKSEDSGQHHRLAFVRAGGIIVELFFISNVNDLAAYDAKKWPLARAVASVLSGV